MRYTHFSRQLNFFRNLAFALIAGFLFLSADPSAANNPGDRSGGGENGVQNFTLRHLLRLDKHERPKIAGVFSYDKRRYTLDNQPNTHELVWELADALSEDQEGTLRIINRVNRAKTPEEKAALLKRLSKQYNKDFQTVRSDIIRLRERVIKEKSTPERGSYAAYTLAIKIFGDDNLFENFVGQAVDPDIAEARKELEDQLDRITFISLFVEEWAKHPEVEIR